MSTTGVNTYIPADKYCQHYACRCARAAELAAMGLIVEAVEVHSQEVKCRLQGNPKRSGK